MSRAKVPLNIENTPLDLTSSFSCLCAAWMYVANRTNSEIGLWQMGAEILGGSSANRKLSNFAAAKQRSAAPSKPPSYSD